MARRLLGAGLAAETGSAAVDWKAAATVLANEHPERWGPSPAVDLPDDLLGD